MLAICPVRELRNGMVHSLTSVFPPPNTGAITSAASRSNTPLFIIPDLLAVYSFSPSVSRERFH